MARKKRILEKTLRRKKTRKLLRMANIGSMDDIQNLFKEAIAEFMENSLKAGLNGKNQGTAGTTIKTQQRPLESIYAVVFLGAIHCHVRSEGQIVKKCSISLLESTWTVGKMFRECGAARMRAPSSGQPCLGLV